IAGLQRQNQLKATNAVSAKLDALQTELARQKAAETAMPECVWCGGRISVGFAKCKHCASDLIWLGDLVGKPGEMEKLRAEAARKEREQEAQRLADEAAFALRRKDLQETEIQNARAAKIGAVVLLILFVIGFIVIMINPH
ncbi:MAG: hypothetical protein EBS38_08425, partial [Actinobacteria bacterium]|nr:hypothetical protein [Actinomycetota bacterium]